MTEDDSTREYDTDAAVNRAVSLLGKLGMTEYAARTLVALYRIGGGTAREVSDASSVPRTKVYDVVEDLQARGLVEVRHTNPREFYAASRQTARRKFEREYERAVTELFDVLSGLPPVEPDHEVDGIWVVTGEEAIYDRMVSLVESANERAVFIAVDGEFPARLGEPLQQILERGVSVSIGGVTDPADLGVTDAVVYSTTGVWTGSDITSLLLVDQSSLLVASPDGSGNRLSAIWAKEERNPLVASFRPMVESWLNTASSRD